MIQVPHKQLHSTSYVQTTNETGLHWTQKGISKSSFMYTIMTQEAYTAGYHN